MSIVSKIKKQTREVTRVSLDYAARLGTGETVTVVASEVCPDTDPPLLAPAAVSLGHIVVSYASGGLDGYDYLVSFLATTSDGRVFEDEVRVQVEDVTC